MNARPSPRGAAIGLPVRLLVLACLVFVVGTAAFPFALHRCGVRPNADESAAIATLKNLASAQVQFRDLAVRDADGDGRGEFGSFVELSAPCTPEGHPLMSKAFARVRPDGAVVRSGYLFRIHLPQADAGEWSFSAWAWPLEYGEGPARRTRVFVVDETGRVWACANAETRYGGSHAPRAEGFDPGRAVLGADNFGADGNHWRRVN